MMNDYGYYQAGQYHYFVKDYQGSVRAVVDDLGEVEEFNHYYPYGALFGTSYLTAVQPLKYGAKELERENGLDWYDSRARWYDPLTVTTPTLDPLLEKYYPLSPHLWCVGNPIRNTDPTGMDIWYLNKNGVIKGHVETSKNDSFYIVNDNGQRTKASLVLPKGTIEQQSGQKTKSGTTYDVYQVRGDDNGTALFEFLASNTSVEWSQVKLGLEDDKGLNFLTTSHEAYKEGGSLDLFDKQIQYGYNFREHIHSHPHNSEFPSGFDNNRGDLAWAKYVSRLYPNAQFKIYTPRNKKYINYNKNSNKKDFLKAIKEYGKPWF